MSKSAMKVLLALTFITKILTFVEKQEFPDITIPNDGLIELKYDYQHEIGKYKHLLIFVYSRDTEFSKAFYPHIVMAARKMKEFNHLVPVARVDCHVITKFGKDFNIDTFPKVILLTQNKSPIEYKGSVDAMEMIDWIILKTSNKIKDFRDPTALETFTKSKEIVIVFFGEVNTKVDSPFLRFDYVMKEFKDYLVYCVCSSPDCQKHFKAAKDSVVIFKMFDELRNDISPGFNHKDLKRFLKTFTIRDVNYFDPKTSEKILNQNVPAIIYFKDRKSEIHSKIETVFAKVARRLKGKTKLLFIVSTIYDGVDGKVAGLAELTQKDLPTVRIMEFKSPENVLKYPFSGLISEKSLLKYISDWTKGTIKPLARSEPIPTEQNKNYTLLVGSTFSDIVYDETKDVLVYFYVGDKECTSCVTVETMFNGLALNLKHNSEIAFGSLDISKNQINSLDFRKGVPYIQLFLIGKKNNPVTYRGELTEFAITNWLTEVTTNPISKRPKNDL